MSDFKNVPKLKGKENYKQWEVAARSTLLLNKTWQVVKPGYVAPPETVTEEKTVITKINGEEKKVTYIHTYNEFDDLNERALAGIHLTILPGPYSQVERVPSAQKAWEKLKQLYGTESWATQESTFFTLMDIRADQFKDLSAFLSRFRELENKLSDLGEPLPPGYLTAIYKRAIPRHLDAILYTHIELALSRNQQLDLDELNTALISHETSNRTEDSKAYAGNFGKQNKGKGKGQNKTSSKEVCNNCFVPGHNEKSCFHSHRELAPAGFVPLLKDDLKKRHELRLEKEAKKNKSNDTQQSDRAYAARFNSNHDDRTKSSEIIIDSGDQEHTNWDRSKFSTYTPVRNQTVSGINDEPLMVKGIGTIIIPAIIDGRVEPFELENVRHVPGMEFNLLSTTQLDLHSFTHSGGHGIKTFFNSDDKVVLQGYMHDRTYYLDTMWAQPSESRALRLKSTEPAKNDASWTVWHKRFGHISMERTKAMAKQAGIDTDAADKLQLKEPHELCEDCMSGKLTKMPSRQPMRKIDVKGQAWHIDLSMASHVVTLGGHTNIMVLTDEATGFTRQVLMKSRAELPEKLEFEFKHLSNQGIKIAYVHGDNELIQGHEAQRLYNQMGIQCLPTAPYNSAQNGIAERKIRTLFTSIRSVLISACLPQEFWGEAAYYVTYINNLIPNKNGKSPYELWYGSTPQAAYLKPFGCWCYAFDQTPRKKKLDNKAIKCRFLGHEGKSIYRVWDISKSRVIRSPHVVFDEKRLINNKAIQEDQNTIDEPVDDEYIDDLLDELSGDPSSHDYEGAQAPANAPADSGVEGAQTAANQQSEQSSTPEYEHEAESGANNQRIPENNHPDVQNDDTVPSALNPIENTPAGNVENQHHQQPQQHGHITDLHKDVYPEPSRRSRRNQPKIDYSQSNKKGMHSRDNPDGFKARITRISENASEAIPLTMKEALNGASSMKWKAGALEELANHDKQSTWNKPCTPPPGTHVISGRWVLAYKFGPMGEIIRWKARWVAKGFQQIEGIDFNETFSATLKASSWRMLLALIAKYDLECECSDVVAAFLEALVHETIWIEQPHEFTDGHPEHACRLNKALYGLKQSSHEWYGTLHTAVKAMGFTRIEHDHCVFINHESGAIIAAYVDDLLFIARNKSLIKLMKDKLSERFNFKHLGDLDEYLGMKIFRNRQQKTLRVNQTKYAQQLLNQLGMDECSIVKSPMEAHYLNPSPSEYTATQEDRHAYQSLMGALNWLSIMTRPDISFAVSVLSRHTSNPSPHHVMATKRVLRYLAGTIKHGIQFNTGLNDGLKGYTDASYCDDHHTSRSTGAYVFKLFNGPVSWQSKLQKLVVTSTCEAEYIAASEACKEALHLGPMLEALGFSEGKAPITINIDNQAAMKLATNPVNHAKTKHIRMRYHLVRQLVSETHEIHLNWVESAEQSADSLTKAIGPININHARNQLGLASYQS